MGERHDQGRSVSPPALGRRIGRRAAAGGAVLRGVAVLVALLVTATLLAVGLTSGQPAAAAGCPNGRSVAFLAHPGDDPVFMNPAVPHDVATGVCVSSVYATSGDAGEGTTYSRSRENGIRASYAEMAGVANTWTTTTITVAGHGITQTTLNAMPTVRLLFLRLPDGNIDGSGT